MRKRANGEGSIRKRIRQRRNGSSYTRFSAVITVGFTAEGKQQQVEGPGRKSLQEALADPSRIRQEKDEGPINSYTITVSEYLDYWLAQIKPKDNSANFKQLAGKTFKGYQEDVINHLKPHLGNLKLRNLNSLTIQRWQNELEKDKSPSVAKNASATLSSALRKAVAWRFLARHPYAKGAITRISRCDREANYWEPSEARQFITASATRGHLYYIAYYLTLTLGLRISELRGLKLKDIIHLRNRATKQPEPYLHIQRQAISDHLCPNFTERLKTKTSNRLIPLSKESLSLLTFHYKAQRSFPNLGLGTIVNNKQGGVPSNGTLRETFYGLCNVARVRKIKFHELRHTAGSLWIESGISLLRTSKWLGHSSMKTTEKIYIHLFREGSSGEQLSLSRLLKPKSVMGTVMESAEDNHFDPSAFTVPDNISLVEPGGFEPPTF